MPTETIPIVRTGYAVAGDEAVLDGVIVNATYTLSQDDDSTKVVYVVRRVNLTGDGA